MLKVKILLFIESSYNANRRCTQRCQRSNRLAKARFNLKDNKAEFSRVNAILLRSHFSSASFAIAIINIYRHVT